MSRYISVSNVKPKKILGKIKTAFVEIEPQLQIVIIRRIIEWVWTRKLEASQFFEDFSTVFHRRMKDGANVTNIYTPPKKLLPL